MINFRKLEIEHRKEKFIMFFRTRGFNIEQGRIYNNQNAYLMFTVEDEEGLGMFKLNFEFIDITEDGYLEVVYDDEVIYSVEIYQIQVLEVKYYDDNDRR